jgi:hypothetical protein
MVHVLDAYCEHLGANLAEGGCVTDAGIRCPFHGWEWDGEGRNVRIPYEARPNSARRMRAWVTCERNEVLYLWHDAAGRAPLWQVPDALTELGDAVSSRRFHAALPDGRNHFPNTRVHPQYVIENVVDLAHFRFVHGAPHAPTLVSEEGTEFSWRAVAGFGKRWLDPNARPDDTVDTLSILWSGPGIAFNVEHTRAGVQLILIATTPVDDASSDMFGTYWLERLPGDETDRADYDTRLARIKAALPDDIRIWHNQRYAERPALTPSEAAGFSALRKWTARFYPQP